MQRFLMHSGLRVWLVLILAAGGAGGRAIAADWPSWRGAYQNGTSTESGLVSSWSPDGENLIWKAPLIGRSTPVVVNGRVYVNGRVGEGITQQEQVACFDAQTGDLLWEYKFNLFHTTVPFNRVGWANPAADPETGYVYIQGVGGMFFCFDGDGAIVWSRSFAEEYGHISGYGGRTNTPIVDGDLVIISFLHSSWGAHAVPRHRYFAFDKRTGTVVWVSAPGGQPLDTTYSTPVVAIINGERLLIGGNADGWVYALQVRTGEKVWGFQLSKRGLNVSVVAEGARVYAAHSEENIDNTSLGRVVCIDATGSGDVTRTHEVWRHDAAFAGYASLLVHDGRLYFVDNAGNLHCLHAASGAPHWQYNLGTVGKGSPVWADGKLYATEVNGRFHILRPGAREAVRLDDDVITMDSGRPAEIYGSPAVAYGRVYFTTEEGLYCLGDKSAPFHVTASPVLPPPEPGPESGAAPAHLQIVPAETATSPGRRVAYRVRAYDAQGRFLRDVPDVTWSHPGLAGTMSADGHWTADAAQGGQAGEIRAAAAGLTATARVRVIPPLPWSEDFQSVAEGKNPPHWVGAGIKFIKQVHNGDPVLVKPPVRAGLNNGDVYFGFPDMQGYTVQADVMGTRDRRNRSDAGIIANRYTLRLLGNHQRLQVYSWASDLRMAKAIDFAWEEDAWYTMQMRVDMEGDRAVIRGKVWRRGDPEPADWTLTVEDPVPNRTGTPGIYGYSAANVYFDNLKVW